MVFLGLYLCKNLLDTVLPEPIERQLESNSLIKSLACEVEQKLFLPLDRGDNLPTANVYLKTMKSGKDRSWYYFNKVFTPTPLEWQIIPLPTWLFPLYYPIRLIRLAIKHGKLARTGKTHS
jgi:hypothetical protein